MSTVEDFVHESRASTMNHSIALSNLNEIIELGNKQLKNMAYS